MALQWTAKQKASSRQLTARFDKTPRTLILITATADYTVPGTVTKVSACPWTQPGEITLFDCSPQVAVAEDTPWDGNPPWLPYPNSGNNCGTRAGLEYQVGIIPACKKTAMDIPLNNTQRNHSRAEKWVEILNIMENN